MKVLILEDQPELGKMVQQGLRELGWTPTWVQTAAAATDALANSTFDLVILDLMLPDRDGLDLLSEWRRARYNQPVLILSARNTMKDRVLGLELGADDYLAKPFSMDELAARLRALTRRHAAHKELVLAHRGIRFEPASSGVTLNGQAIALTQREVALLEIFLRNIGRVVTRSLLMEKVWEAHHNVAPNLLDVYISRLRTKLDHGDDKPVFETIRGIGYRMR